jgi:hypothetical protein
MKDYVILARVFSDLESFLCACSVRLGEDRKPWASFVLRNADEAALMHVLQEGETHQQATVRLACSWYRNTPKRLGGEK